MAAEAFDSLMGILAGDSSSPILWTIYLSDLGFGEDTDDIKLYGTPISNMEQADNISITPQGLQRKMDTLWDWCGRNAMVVNAVKSYIILFDHSNRNVQVPPFRFGNDAVSVVPETTYVGFHLTSEGNNLFAPHYKQARRKWSGMSFSDCTK
jgi:hypothetical protein